MENTKCPNYQGVCGLDNNAVCYRASAYLTCDIYMKNASSNQPPSEPGKVTEEWEVRPPTPEENAIIDGSIKLKGPAVEWKGSFEVTEQALALSGLQDQLKSLQSRYDALEKATKGLQKVALALKLESQCERWRETIAAVEKALEGKPDTLVG